MKTRVVLATVLVGSLSAFVSHGAMAQTGPAVPGYTHGQKSLARAPYTLQDLESLKTTMIFTDEDVSYLRMSKAILADQTDAILDVWYGFVASTP